LPAAARLRVQVGRFLINNLWSHIMFTLLHDGDQTQLDTMVQVVRVARPDDPVYVPGRGWMTVGDLRWDMTGAAEAGSDSGNARIQ